MRRAIVIAASAMVATGCNQPHERLNSPPHGRAEKSVDMQGTFVYMNDNALLANMTVCDMHFMPHRAKLNGQGVERLSRLASLLEAYGGTIRFDTRCEDESLNKQRLEVIHDFLAETGIDTTSEVVRADVAGGEGMEATEAIMIRVKEGMYQDKKAGSVGAASDASKSQTSSSK